METTIDATASLQECGLTLCKVVDEAHRHTNVYRLPSSLGQTAPETDTAQFSRLLGLEKTISVSGNCIVTKRLASSELVVMSVERDGRPVTGTICEQYDDLY